MLIVKVLSLFSVESNDEKPLPTMPVIGRACRSIAEISEDDLISVLERLSLYGLIHVHDGVSTYMMRGRDVKIFWSV